MGPLVVVVVVLLCVVVVAPCAAVPPDAPPAGFAGAAFGAGAAAFLGVWPDAFTNRNKRESRVVMHRLPTLRD